MRRVWGLSLYPVSHPEPRMPHQGPGPTARAWKAMRVGADLGSRGRIFQKVGATAKEVSCPGPTNPNSLDDGIQSEWDGYPAPMPPEALLVMTNILSWIQKQMSNSGVTRSRRVRTAAFYIACRF